MAYRGLGCTKIDVSWNCILGVFQCDVIVRKALTSCGAPGESKGVNVSGFRKTNPLYSTQDFAVERSATLDTEVVTVIWAGSYDAHSIPSELMVLLEPAIFQKPGDPPRIELDFRRLEFINSRMLVFIAKVFYNLRNAFKYFVVHYDAQVGFQRKLFQTLKGMSASFDSDTYVYFKEGVVA